MNKKQQNINDLDRAAKRCNEIGLAVELRIEGSLYDPNYEISSYLDSNSLFTFFRVLVSTVETMNLDDHDRSEQS